jgi:hypothetical protein
MLGGRSPCEINLNGIQHLTASETRTGRARAQQDFVDIVMQDYAKPAEIVKAKSSGNFLRKCIANRVGMTGPLPLDHFGFAQFRRRVRTSLDR